MFTKCVDKFCSNLSLEYSGYVIGGLGFLCGIYILVSALVKFFIPEYYYLVYYLNEIYILNMMSISIVYALLHIIASIYVIIGTKYRQHRKIIMMLIVLIFDFILIFITFFFYFDIIYAVLKTFVLWYFIQCIFSLYIMFKNENESINTLVDLDDQTENSCSLPKIENFWNSTILTSYLLANHQEPIQNDFSDEEYLLKSDIV
ncbi:hypothetical protein PVAND_006031 [Polypedilum vanderplanki]|uniref:Transmembrane protein n=1 Tax=Polypedilum vanderplanki TaxID=319348 RepID=A0A9J6C3R4_POLVA|nr:hypothetical protein PVAND_006031 [Polypedilum vanderplanki]